MTESPSIDTIMKHIPTKEEAIEASKKHPEQFMVLHSLLMKWWVMMEMTGNNIPKKDIGPMLVAAAAIIGRAEYENAEEFTSPN